MKDNFQNGIANQTIKMTVVLFILNLVVTTNIFAQNKNTEKVTVEDIKSALEFSGVEIFKFKIDKIKTDCKLYIIVDEYASKDNFIKTDTLMRLTDRTKGIDLFRFIFRVVNGDYEKINFNITAGPTSVLDNFKIRKEYARKHYWRQFENSVFAYDKKIPLLLLGSEWDFTINDKKVPGFCGLTKIPADLSGEPVNSTPHFMVISYLLTK